MLDQVLRLDHRVATVNDAVSHPDLVITGSKGLCEDISEGRGRDNDPERAPLGLVTAINVGRKLYRLPIRLALRPAR